MTGWIASLNAKRIENWDICVRDGVYGTSSGAARRVRAGDDLFLWFSKSGLQAHCRALADATPVDELNPEPWKDGAKYRWIWPIEVVVERQEPVARTQGEVDALVGRRVMLNQWTEVDPAGTARLARALTPGVGRADYVSVLGLDLDYFGKDHRRVVNRSIAARRGQPRFRSDLFAAYGGRCAVTDTPVAAVLEAAHISPYRGDHTNRVDNGLLLRADIHTLFDLDLLTVTPELTVRVSGVLAGTGYSDLDGQPLLVPAVPRDRPNPEVLKVHNARCRWLGGAV